MPNWACPDFALPTPPFQEAWMHNDGKVVPINKAQTTPSPLARLPVVLLQVRDKAAQQLQQGL